MQEAGVSALLDALEGRGVRAWVAGGWAVGALVGRRTRDHADLDLAVDAAQLDAAMALLAQSGFALTVDELPSRAELTTGDGRRVDLHPVRFPPDGSGEQARPDGMSFRYAAGGFAVGVIDGRAVPCLGARQQLAFREGYEPRAVDHHDVALLRGLSSS